MKLASLLIPAYLPKSHPGATPTPYQSGTVDKFERELSAMSPLVVRRANATRLMPDQHGRFVGQEIVTHYDVLVDPASSALGDAITLALKSFGLQSVTVQFDGEAEDFNLAAAEELVNGLHPWCD